LNNVPSDSGGKAKGVPSKKGRQRGETNGVKKKVKGKNKTSGISR